MSLEKAFESGSSVRVSQTSFVSKILETMFPSMLYSASQGKLGNTGDRKIIKGRLAYLDKDL